MTNQRAQIEALCKKALPPRENGFEPHEYLVRAILLAITLEAPATSEGEGRDDIAAGICDLIVANGPELERARQIADALCAERDEFDPHDPDDATAWLYARNGALAALATRPPSPQGAVREAVLEEAAKEIVRIKAGTRYCVGDFETDLAARVPEAMLHRGVLGGLSIAREAVCAIRTPASDAGEVSDA